MLWSREMRDKAAAPRVPGRALSLAIQLVRGEPRPSMRQQGALASTGGSKQKLPGNREEPRGGAGREEEPGLRPAEPESQWPRGPRRLLRRRSDDSKCGLGTAELPGFPSWSRSRPPVRHPPLRVCSSPPSFPPLLRPEIGPQGSCVDQAAQDLRGGWHRGSQLGGRFCCGLCCPLA